MKQILLYAALAVLFASQMVKASEPTTLTPTTSGSAKKFVVHEWGTFTSVLDSNGKRMGGLHHEEEQLPSFIIGRNLLNETTDIPGHCYKVKGMEFCDDPVYGNFVRKEDITQKMETPVIYFYSAEKRNVQVNVSFPQGIISQYYPDAFSFRPARGEIRGLEYGSAQFNVEVVTEKLPLPKVEHGNVYAPAREVASNDIRYKDQNERFIFYRGLGNFATSLNVKSARGEGITLTNTLKTTIPSVILLDVTSSTGAVASLGSLSGSEIKEVSAKNLMTVRADQLPRAEFEKRAQEIIVEALVNSGLYLDESVAMFNTWKTSYLRSHGLRLLYILPRAETDTLLPLYVYPTPDETVRTLVGRIEILHADEEQQMIQNLRSGKPLVLAHDRFAEPKLRGLLNLVSDPVERSLVQKQIDLLNQQ